MHNLTVLSAVRGSGDERFRPGRTARPDPPPARPAQSTGAIGDLQIVSLRPFGRTHVGAVGDCINVAARLMGVAGPGQIAVSNTFYQALDDASQARFHEIEPVEAKNVGRIKTWLTSAGNGG